MFSDSEIPDRSLAALLHRPILDYWSNAICWILMGARDLQRCRHEKWGVCSTQNTFEWALQKFCDKTFELLTAVRRWKASALNFGRIFLNMSHFLLTIRSTSRSIPSHYLSPTGGLSLPPDSKQSFSLLNHFEQFKPVLELSKFKCFVCCLNLNLLQNVTI